MIRPATARQRDRDLCDALRTIAAATRSGQSFSQACSAAGARVDGPVGDAFAAATAQLALGMPASRVVAQLADSIGGDSAELFALVMLVQHRRGGELAPLCQRLAMLLHERRRLVDEAMSATAQARFTARAVLGLPALVMFVWALVDPSSLLALVSGPAAIALVPAVLLMSAGILVIRRLATQAVVGPAGHPGGEPWMELAVRRIAGAGPVRRQRLRLVAAAFPIVVLSLASGVTLLNLFGSIALIGGAYAWPRLSATRADRRLHGVVADGLPALLELSIALLAAGATPRETILESVQHAPGALGRQLREALPQIRLGRSPESALRALPAVHASPDLDTWLGSLSSGERFGSPVSEALGALLRDARSAEREHFRRQAATAAPRIQLATVALVVPAILWVVLVATAHGLVSSLRSSGIVDAG